MEVALNLNEVEDAEQFNTISYQAFSLHMGRERMARPKQTKTLFQRKLYWLNKRLICALLVKYKHKPYQGENVLVHLKELKSYKICSQSKITLKISNRKIMGKSPIKN